MTPAVQRIVDTLDEQVLALEQLRELITFFGGPENFANEPNPWLAVNRYLESVSEAVEAASSDLSRMPGEGGAS
jgi:hypothetical protein